MISPDPPLAPAAAPSPVAEPSAAPSTEDEAAGRDESGEGAASALALLKRRQQARRLVQPSPTPEGA